MAPKAAARSKSQPDPQPNSTPDNSQTASKKKNKDTGPAISWTKDISRTDRLIDWLEQNVADRQKLFSDSSQDAKSEGRKQRVANGSKSKYHQLIATAVFSVDADAKVREDYEASPTKYIKAIENRLAVLKAKYRTFNTELGQTGAGLRKEDITLGSDISNKIDELEKDFPFWSRLHGFWRTLPNINPHTVSSEPGQDLEGDAIRHMSGEGLRETQENDAAIGSGMMHEPVIDDEIPGEPGHTLFDDDQSAWQFGQDRTDSEQSGDQDDHDDRNRDDVPATEPPRSQKSRLAHSRASSYSKLPASSKASSLSKKPLASDSTRVSGTSVAKRSRLDAFREETEIRDRNMVQLASKKLDFKTAELAVKKQKIEATNQREMEKERLAMEERMLQQKERIMEKEHIRQKESESHQERILQLQIQLAQTQGTSAAQSAHMNFSNHLTNPNSNFDGFGGFGSDFNGAAGM